MYIQQQSYSSPSLTTLSHINPGYQQPQNQFPQSTFGLGSGVQQYRQSTHFGYPPSNHSSPLLGPVQSHSSLMNQRRLSSSNSSSSGSGSGGGVGIGGNSGYSSGYSNGYNSSNQNLSQNPNPSVSAAAAIMAHHANLPMSTITPSVSGSSNR